VAPVALEDSVKLTLRQEISDFAQTSTVEVAKSRSPQDHAGTRARTRAYEKKHQPQKWLVFFIGGAGATE